MGYGFLGQQVLEDAQVIGQLSMRRIIRDWYKLSIMHTVDEEEQVMSDGFTRPCSGYARPKSLILIIMRYKSCPQPPGGGGGVEIGMVGYTEGNISERESSYPRLHFFFSSRCIIQSPRYRTFRVGREGVYVYMR